MSVEHRESRVNEGDPTMFAAFVFQSGGTTMTDGKFGGQDMSRGRALL